MMSIQIKAAQADQLSALVQLLSQNQLPTNDLPNGLPNFWLAFDDDRLIGSVGIEIYGSAGLLRSVCVNAQYRNQGIARQLFRRALQEVHQQGINDVYLLTTTADRYFERFGFTLIDRTSTPEAIQQTTQFSSLCPSSAIVMKQTYQSMKRILVLCTGNSTRSQMAQGYLQHFAGEYAEVLSAGIETHGLNPKAVQIMAEDGIDISHHTSNLVDDYTDLPIDYVITVCDHANERCPVWVGKATRIHKNFTDPSKAAGSAEEIWEIYRTVRNEIREFSRNFVEKELS